MPGNKPGDSALLGGPQALELAARQPIAGFRSLALLNALHARANKQGIQSVLEWQINFNRVRQSNPLVGLQQKPSLAQILYDTANNEQPSAEGKATRSGDWQ